MLITSSGFLRVNSPRSNQGNLSSALLPSLKQPLMHGDQSRNETAWIAVRMPACTEQSSFWPEPASTTRYQGTSFQTGSFGG